MSAAPTSEVPLSTPGRWARGLADAGAAASSALTHAPENAAYGLMALAPLGATFGPVAMGLALLGAAVFLFPMLWFTRKVSRALGLELPDEIVAVFCGSKKTLASGMPMAKLLFGGNAVMGVLILPIMLYH